MFFGLCNSPVTFQTMMDDIFNGLITEGVVVVYLDDILIFMETLKEHWRVTWRVMELLRKNNLFLKPEKCKFKKTEVEYFGVIISQDSVKMDPVKVAGVTEWPIPSNRKEVQSFLGFTNFYRRFIQGFSHLARPLFDLTQKDTDWRWGAEEQSAFECRFTQGMNYNSSDPRPARQLMTFSDRSRQLGFRNQSRIVSTITGRQQMASCCIPFQIPFSGGAEL